MKVGTRKLRQVVLMPENDQDRALLSLFHEWRSSARIASVSVRMMTHNAYAAVFSETDAQTIDCWFKNFDIDIGIEDISTADINAADQTPGVQ